MFIRFGYTVEIELPQPTTLATVLDVHPSRAKDVVTQSFSTEPATLSRPVIDAFGNACRIIAAPAGRFVFRASGLARDSGNYETYDTTSPVQPVHELPLMAFEFLKPSRYCEVDLLGPLAWERFGAIEGAHAKVKAVCDFAHGALRFNYGAARPTRTAAEAAQEGTGVCRDFSHLAVTLCRCLNIPARYATGYLGDIGVPPDPAPMDFSAWFEAYIGGKWWTYDARHNTPRIGRIVMGYGRDAADVAMVTSFGPHFLKKFEVVTEETNEQETRAIA